MRLVIILLIASGLQVAARPGDAQNVTLTGKNIPLEKIFKEIRKQTDYQFFYKDEYLESARPVDIRVINVPVREALDICFKSQPLSYSILNNKIIVVRRKTDPPVALASPPLMLNQITGKVTDSLTGRPLIGVTIQVKGNSMGTVTDAQGRFSLEVPENAVLVVSYLGYDKREIPVNGRSVIDISLKPSATALNQLVVTALGMKQEKRTLTYITQEVNTEPLTEARSLNMMNSLEGKVAGLSISESGGGAGSSSRVTLRGNRSINGDSQPLYIVDGVPTLGYPEYLDPDNVISINVLKGANAAALYGSDAQNGAIIITTKKGQEGKIRVSLNNTVTFSRADLGMPLQNQYGQGVNGVYQNGAIESWGPQMNGQSVQTWSLNPAKANQTYNFSPQPNNINDLFRTGVTISNNLQASMGGQKIQGFISATSTEGQGILPNNDLQRNNLLVRAAGDLSKKFTIDAKLSYTRQKIDNPTRESDNNFNPMQQIYLMPRNIRTQDAKDFEFAASNGVMQQDFWAPGRASTAENPYWVLNRNISNDMVNRITGMASLTYNIFDGFNLMVRSSYDRIDDYAEQKDYDGTLVRALYGRYTVTQSQQYEFNSDFLLSYQRSFNQDWSLDGHVGGNLKKQLLGEYLSGNTGPALLIPNFFNLANTNYPQVSNNPGSPVNIQSLYAFGKLGWKNAVFLDLTGRNDWSSTLPANSRSYFYPSAGLSAIISDLIPSFPKLFDFAKVRASYAQVGSSAAPFMLQRTATFSPGGTNGFLTLNGVLPNTNLKPEQTESFETGFDVRLLKGRLGLGFTYFNTNTINQLFTINLPVASGATSFFTNGGNVQNKGEEIVLNTIPVQSKNLTWTLDVNFAHLKNTVISISDQRPKVTIATPGDAFFSDYVVKQGLAFGDMFTVGLLRDSLGRVIVGKNGVPQVTNQRNFDIGSYTPDWTGSISSSLSYKDFSLSVVIDHRQGGVVGSFTAANLAWAGLTQNTIQGRSGDLIFGKNFFPGYTAVTTAGNPNDIPVNAETFWKAMGNPSVPVGELFAQNATNTRLRELIIGYSLSKAIVSRLHLSGVKVSLVGRNLCFISRATPGLDPDILAGTATSSEGFSSFPPPTTRSYGVNLKIDF